MIIGGAYDYLKLGWGKGKPIVGQFSERTTRWEEKKLKAPKTFPKLQLDAHFVHVSKF